MSSTYSSSSTSSRAWWSLGSRQPTQQDVRKSSSPEKQSRSGLNSIAVALGFKSKRQPMLTIQDPQFPTTRTPPLSIDTKAGGIRPPSKSVSQSRLDSPVDPPRRSRQSLLTLSDTDPFAVRSGSSALHTPSDSNHPFNSFTPAIISKSMETEPARGSYNSLVSTDNTQGVSFPTQVSPDHLSKRSTRKVSTRSLGKHWQRDSEDHELELASEAFSLLNNISAAISSSPSLPTSNQRLSQPHPTPPSRPPGRARGLTNPSTVQRSNFLAETVKNVKSVTPPLASPPSPLVIIRQPSVSRIGLPPSAPPQQDLPPPPSSMAKDDDAELRRSRSTTNSPSSSSLSFVSSASSTQDALTSKSSNAKRARKVSDHSSVKGDNILHSTAWSSPLSTPRTLKRALSHQSFGKNLQSPMSSPQSPPPELPASPKVPRKQRSFHQAKISNPVSRPIHSSHSFGSQEPSSPSDSPYNQRRGSAPGITIPGRKRLFSSSSSRRPSTTQSALPDGDARSVFSVRSDPDQRRPLLQVVEQPISPVSGSFWVETAADRMSSSSHKPLEYTPQQIMSPAEMAMLEDTQEVSPNHSRDLQAPSNSLALSMGDREVKPPVGSRSFLEPLDLSNSMDNIITMSDSPMRSELPLSPRLSSRTSTSQASISTPSESDMPSPKSTPANHSIASLPPPPRRSRTRTLGFNEPDVIELPLPPGRKSSRPQVSFEKALHRRSIMKKPSFLEIDDETDQDTDIESPVGLTHGSFLNLARDSFDTTRSISE